MITKTTKKLTPQELQIEYNNLAQKYYELKLSYRERAEKYNAVLKSKRLLSKQIQRWSRRYQRMKITIAASTIKTADFSEYAASFESSNEEIKRLETLVLDLSLRNDELVQSLEKSTMHAQAPQWQNENLAGSMSNSPVIVDFSAKQKLAASRQAASV